MRNGIQLIHVFENEWIEKQEIVKSIILAKLGKFEKIIEKFKIRKIDNIEYENFCLVNNIFGYISVDNMFGIYSDDLIQVIGVKDDEIICNCSKLNLKVIGSLDKFNFPVKIDLRYFDRREFPNWEVLDEYEPELNEFTKVWDCGNLKLKYRVL